MFKHEKNLLEMVRIEKSNPTYAVMLQDQLGGPHGEMKAAMQYISQSFRIKDQEIKDLFLDIAAEELSHMEMVGTAINLLNGHDVDASQVAAGNIQAHTQLGLGPGLTTSSGFPWTAAYIEATGDLPADLLSNIAAEQRAKVVYQYLHRQINDNHVRQMIDFLLNREEAHNALFREALRKVQNTGSNLDYGVDEHSRLYFDLSTPGRYFAPPSPTPPVFQNPRSGGPQQ
ncbi:MAG: manganese catalase family protein [Firmicutes bacterium]|nr:manganese catalase family protein [Bacillota bacterium]MCL5038944.1 manganese catalase family protein [Bacillota bacterium]